MTYPETKRVWILWIGKETHWGKAGILHWQTACGYKRYRCNARAFRPINGVTCKNCKRTKAFKMENKK